MPTRKHILFISTNPAPWGGSEEMWFHLSSRALMEGHLVTVSLFRHPTMHPRVKKLKKAGARIHLRSLPAYYEDQSFLNWMIAHLKLRLHWDKLPFIWRGALRSRPDHIFISGGETLDGCMFDHTWLIRKAKEANIPYSIVGHFHHDYSKILSAGDRASKRNYLCGARGLYFVSHRNWRMTAHEIQDDLPKARVIFNPILEIAQRKHPIPSKGPIRMAFVARLECAVKCQDLAINTLAQDCFRTEDFLLDIYGEGPDRTYLEELIRYHGLEDKVRLIGHHPSPGEIWEDHDLLVLTSRGEGTPLVILEAMRAGVPSLVTNAGDSALWINNERGYVAEAISMEALTETFRCAFHDRADWNAKGSRCRAFFEASWTNRHMEDLYADICGKNVRAGIPASKLPEWLEARR
jgi:L-malate glycosyltransferase